jgi:hypothetical protein
MLLPLHNAFSQADSNNTKDKKNAFTGVLDESKSTTNHNIGGGVRRPTYPLTYLSHGLVAFKDLKRPAAFSFWQEADLCMLAHFCIRW